MAVFTFLKVNGLPVAIPDATSASPNVPGLVTQTMNVFVTGTIEDVNFTITGLTHTWANDLDLALFGPNPNNNLILMSDAGGSSDFSNSTLTFDDSGTSSLLNNDTPISDGTYLPTNHSVATSGNINPVETTAQFGFISSTLNNPGPTGTSTFDSVFTGTDLNGTWTFAASDDGNVDVGSFGNWLLQIQTDSTETSITGTSGADNLTIASTSATAGQMVFNGGLASFTGLGVIFYHTEGGLDTLVGGDGEENIIEGDALDGDSFNGGVGIDSINYSNVSFLGAGYTTVVFDLFDGSATSNTLATETIQNFDDLTASDTEDTIFGTATANNLSGVAGNDQLFGRDGADQLYGGAGNDILHGGDAADEVYGGLGNDELHMNSQDENVAGEVIDGGDDIDTIFVSGNGSYVHDLSDDTLISIEALTLDTETSSTGEVRILATQINGTSLAVNLNVTGSSDPNVADRLVIDMTGATSLFLTNFVMTEFGSANDRVVVNASTGAAVTIYGTGGGDEIHGSSSNDPDQLYGGGGNDSVYGEAGDDDITGGLGADALFGGAGNFDWAYYSDETENLVINLANSLLNSGAAAAGDTYDGVEGLIAGSGNDLVTGNDDNNRLDGRSGNDTIYGGAGIDYITGDVGNDVLLGGAGADVLDGGTGDRDRVQYTDSTGGLRIDLANSNTNTGIAAGDSFSGIEDVYGSIHSDIIFGDNIGNILYGDAGQDLFGAGGGNDTIYGGAGNDAMGGGGGADVMFGGTGNDIFYVNVVEDQTIEVAGEGTADNIYTTLATFSIASLLNIEFMTGISATAQTLIGNSLNNIMAGGNASDVLSGGSGNDTIYGGAGNDALGGGVGNDYYFGGTGNDLFYVDSLTDTIIEDVAGGTADTIAVVLTSYSMATRANVENLTGLLTTGQLLVGNTLSNIITGNTGNDILMGGLGNDTLIGGAGADQFEFNTALGATNVDTIQSYSVADDTIRLENAIFTALSTGALAGTAFFTGAAATTAAHRIIFNSATGQLFYDADGTGAAAQTLFAILTPTAALTAADFLVV